LVMSRGISAGIAETEFTVTAFITDTILVFLVGIAAMLLNRLFLWRERKRIQRVSTDLSYYVIGFFFIGIMILIWIVSVVFSKMGLSRLANLETTAYVLLAFYFVLLWWLLQRLTLDGFKAIVTDDSSPPYLRLLISNGLIIGLCALSFIYPLIPSESDAVLTGYRLEVLPPTQDSLGQFTYVLENPGDSTVLIQRAKYHSIIVKPPELAQLSAKASFTECYRSNTSDTDYFLIGPKESLVLTSFVCDEKLKRRLGVNYDLASAVFRLQLKVFTQGRKVPLSTEF